jgi:hypothetical protein
MCQEDEMNCSQLGLQEFPERGITSQSLINNFGTSLISKANQLGNARIFKYCPLSLTSWEHLDIKGYHTLQGDNSLRLV